MTPEDRRRQADAERAAEAARDARLLKWARRQVNGDLREWRAHLKAGTTGPLAGRLPGLVADSKAKLRLISWAESWQRVRDPDHACPDARVQAEMLAHLSLVMYAVRYLAAGYDGRDGYREEWRTGR